MRVLVILYEGFTEYEYQIPVLALHFFAVPFDTVGLDTTNITGMMGLRASLELTLSEVDPARYSALLLPGIDRSKRDQIAKNMSLLTLIRDFDQAQKLIAMGISSLGWVRGFFTSQHCSWKHCWEKCRQKNTGSGLESANPGNDLAWCYTDRMGLGLLGLAIVEC